MMRGWHDIADFDFSHDQDEVGMRESCKVIEGLIQKENKRGIVASKIILAGFSQGGALALFAGLRYPDAVLVSTVGCRA